MQETNDTTNLWTLEEGREKQLTHEVHGIWDYHVAPNGKGILYSAIDDDNTIDLIQLTPNGERVELLDCRDARCTALTTMLLQPGHLMGRDWLSCKSD